MLCNKYQINGLTINVKIKILNIKIIKYKFSIIYYYFKKYTGDDFTLLWLFAVFCIECGLVFQYTNQFLFGLLLLRLERKLPLGNYNCSRDEA